MAAIDMQLRVADLPPISGLKLTIRIGLHCGEIVEQFDTVLGEAVNTTARITGMARVDQILASKQLADLLPSTCLKIMSSRFVKWGAFAKARNLIESGSNRLAAP